MRLFRGATQVASNNDECLGQGSLLTFWLRTGEKINLGTCPDIPGGVATGDTYLRLFGPESTQTASNDDACSDGSGASAITYTVAPGGEGTYELRGGCYSAATCYGSIGLRDQ